MDTGEIIYDDVNTEIKNFLEFLQRDNYHLADDRRELYRIYVLAIKKMNDYLEFGGSSLTQFKAEMNAFMKGKNTVSRAWLTEKIEQLE